MNAAMMRRLEALERLSGKQGSSDPSRIYEFMASAGIEAPEPSHGETTENWLKRVSDESLEALMNYRRNGCLLVTS